MGNRNSITYAESIGHYWKTGKSGVETWITKIVKLLKGVNAENIDTAIVNSTNGYFIIVRFVLENDNFCINWQALPTRTDQRAAQIQAATFLYHDIKAKCMVIKIKGSRKTFFEYLVLPNGQVASEATMPELSAQIPKILLPSSDKNRN